MRDLLVDLANDLRQEGTVDERECFINGMFPAAKEGKGRPDTMDFLLMTVALIQGVSQLAGLSLPPQPSATLSQGERV